MEGVDGPATDVGEDFVDAEDEETKAGGGGGGADWSRGGRGAIGVARWGR